MIPEIGNFALMVATAVALVLGTLPIIGAARGNAGAGWPWPGRPHGAVPPGARRRICLVSSFLHDDFSVRYVAINSTHALPVQYKLAAFWGGHEGSLLLVGGHPELLDVRGEHFQRPPAAKKWWRACWA